MHTSQKVERAAKQFFCAVVPNQQWDYSAHPAKPLILSAFHLYQLSWGARFDIAKWEWPFRELQEGGAFMGDNPWTLLLRRAVEMERADRKAEAT